MTKKILILSFYYPPDLCAGSFRTKALIESLEPLAQTQNIQIDIITTIPNRYADFQMSAKILETKGCVTIYRIKIPTHKSGFIDQAKAFAHYFFKTLKITRDKQYGVVYATSSRLFTAFLGARIATKKKIPLFLDIRDIFTDTMKSILKFPLNLCIPFFNLIERYTIKKANILNLVSSGFLPYFKTRDDCEVTTISHGVDIFFRDIQSGVRENRLIKRVLYAGNIGQGQGIEKIIPALAIAFKNQCEFYIIGNGGQKEKLEKACYRLKNITIFPPVDREKLMQHYNDSDILFLHLNNLPAFNKVLPSKIFEYAMTGKPILAGVSGYAADFFRREISNSCIFQPCNAEQAITQLNYILSSDMKSKDNNMFYEKFNREKLMNELATKIVSLV